MGLSTTEKRAALRRLHAGPQILVMPNAWDVVSARIFEDAGFAAVATSSAAVAWSLGFPDGSALDVDVHLAALERIVHALGVPVSADVENGYAADPAALAAFVRRLDAAGVAGYNLEDTMTPSTVHPLAEARERVRAAREAAPELFLNARTDLYLAEIGPEKSRLDATIERLRAFADAGADGVFVPGVSDPETIAALAAATPLPLNVLANPQGPDAAALQRLGVRRVSVGSWPMRRVLGELRAIAGELRSHGTFAFARERTVAYGELNALMAGPGA